MKGVNKSILNEETPGCEMKAATRYALRRAINSNLVKTAHGRAFDGVLQDASINMTASGHIFGASPRFKNGEFIETSEIVKVGHVLANGYYVETMSGSRYLVASVEFNPGFSETTSSLDAAFKFKETHLGYNEAYYSEFQWSNS